MKLLALLLFFICTAAQAYTYNFDPPAKVGNHNKYVYYNHSGAPSTLNGFQVKVLIKTVLETWRQECPHPLEWGGYTTLNPATLEDNVFVVGWAPVPFGMAAFVSGLAEQKSDGSWKIMDLTMIIDPNKVTDYDFLEEILVHEIGHMLGLGHSEYNNVVMSGPPYSQYNSLSVLQPDDIQGCLSLYN